MLRKLVLLTFAFTLFGLGCFVNSSNATNQNVFGKRTLELPQNNLNLNTVGEKISENVGFINTTFSGESGKQFIIFEENHAIPKGQVEIALMIHRLYANYGVTAVGLEGAFYSNGRVKADWNFGEHFEKEKLPVATQLLKEGEINCAEFISIVNPNIHVFGIENEKEYNVKNADSNSTPILQYLLQIILREIEEGDMLEFERIMVEKKDTVAAYEFLFSSNEFTKKYYNKSDFISIEDEIEKIVAIITKAETVEAEISPYTKDDMFMYLEFMKTASKRSDTMIDYALKATTNYGNSMVLIIGAGHTDRMTNILEANQHSYVVISPNALKNENARLSNEQYRMKLQGLSVDDGILGELLNNKKPPIVLNKRWLKTKANIYASTRVIAKSVRRNLTVDEYPEEELLVTLQGMETQDFKVNYASLALVGDLKDEVIFEISVRKPNSSTFENLWVKTKQIIHQEEKKNKNVDEIEYQLKKTLNEMENQDNVSQTDPSNRIKLIANDSLACFTKKKSDVVNIQLQRS